VDVSTPVHPVATPCAVVYDRTDPMPHSGNGIALVHEAAVTLLR